MRLVHGPGGGRVVELRLWGVPGRRDVLAAMRQAGRSVSRLGRAEGLRFGTVLGTGAGRSFTPLDADLHHWALLTAWDDEAAADAHAATPAVRDWAALAGDELVVRMRPLISNGSWAGVQPFAPAPDGASDRSWDGPVAAITRARLRATRAVSFWRAVPPVADVLAGTPGVDLAIGIGELPLGLQGTFSLWRSAADLTDFAYRSEAHRAVVAATAPQRWYAEELFARLAVTSVSGSSARLREAAA